MNLFPGETVYITTPGGATFCLSTLSAHPHALMVTGMTSDAVKPMGIGNQQVLVDQPPLKPAEKPKR